MLMKIIIAVLSALLVMTLAAGALFYLKEYKPVAEDHARLIARMPELDKAKIELRHIKEKESRETAWLNPTIGVLSAALGEEIKSGKAEVFAAGNKIVVNISEQALYLPGAYTFAKESPQLRATLVTLLKSDILKGRDIYIGNTTEAVPAQGRGRKKVPAKDARTLAAERSAVLIRDFEKNGVHPDALIAAAFSSKKPVPGSLIKSRKTVIIIENPIENPAAAQVAAPKQAAASQAPAQPGPDTRSAVTVPAPRPTWQAQPRPIPIQPAQPKAQ